jgi:pyridoxal phosphate enzyme (YggS family)
VTLVVVSKMRQIEEVRTIYDLGHRVFAENRVPDLLDRRESLPDDIDWHLIGTLQSNKVKYIAPFIRLIHSLDDMHLWQEVHKQAVKHNRIIPCLLQIKIAREETKSGFDWNTLISVLKEKKHSSFSGVSITGVMGMATFTEDADQVRQEFRQLKKYFDELKRDYFDQKEFVHLSMGMSGDYKIAIEEGSTMVRVGSLIFE